MVCKMRCSQTFRVISQTHIQTHSLKTEHFRQLIAGEGIKIKSYLYVTGECITHLFGVFA